MRDWLKARGARRKGNQKKWGPGAGKVVEVETVAAAFGGSPNPISAKDKITPLGPEQFKTLCLSVHRLSSYLNQNPRL